MISSVVVRQTEAHTLPMTPGPPNTKEKREIGNNRDEGEWRG